MWVLQLDIRKSSKMKMKRVVSCSRPLVLALLACLTVDTFAAPITDDLDFNDNKNSTPELNHMVIQTVREILKENQNKNSRSASDGVAGWSEMMNRSLPWIPWLMMMTMGRNNAPCPCTTTTPPYPTFAVMPPPPFYGPSHYGYPPPQYYRSPELYPATTANIAAFPQNQFQLPSEFNISPQTFLESTQPQTNPNLMARSYNYYGGGHQPYSLFADTTSFYPDQQFTTAEDLVQQQGIMKAIKSRLKSELANVATKINPVEQSQPLLGAQPSTSTLQPAVVTRKSSPIITTTDYQQRALPKTEKSSTPATAAAGQQSRSSKPSLWKQVASVLNN